MSDQEKKDNRRQKLSQNHKKEKISEEQRFVSKSKKRFKKEIEQIKAEELWEDWENEIY